MNFLVAFLIAPWKKGQTPKFDNNKKTCQAAILEGSVDVN
jgi:hypothetical protein